MLVSILSSGFVLCNVMLISVCVCGLQGPRQVSPLGTIKCSELNTVTLFNDVRCHAIPFSVLQKYKY